jgi:hypothetical protein
LPGTENTSSQNKPINLGAMILEQGPELNSGKACWQKIFSDYPDFLVLSPLDVPN